MTKTTTLLIAFLIFTSTLFSQQMYRRTLKLMGTRFDISVVDKDSVKAKYYIDIAIKEIKRIEKLISSWDSASQTSLINRNAGIKAVRVDEELINLINAL